MIPNNIEENANMKILRFKLSTAKQRVTKLKNKQNIEDSSAEEIRNVIEDFYRTLYISDRFLEFRQKKLCQL